MKNRLNHASPIICGLLLLSAAAPLHALDFGDWGRKAEITFSGYEGTETLTNFPALVVLGPGTITGFAYDDCQAGGADLRFSDSTGLVELPYEIEQWNPAGDSLVWVRVPELVDADTSIWAYWGSPVATAPAYTTDGSTWDSNFVAVWHMNQPSSRDSTANALHATSQGTTLDAVGFVGVGQNLNGNYLSVANNALLNFTSPGITMSGFAKPNAVGTESALMRKESQYQLGFYSATMLRPLLATTTTTGTTRLWSHTPLTP